MELIAIPVYNGSSRKPGDENQRDQGKLKIGEKGNIITLKLRDFIRNM